MLFDEKFDQSLWCIVKGDKKNRKQIVEFIKELPVEFIEMVREGIEKYRQIEDPYSLEADIFNEYLVGDKVSYYFQIERFGMQNYLRLKKEILNGKFYDSVIELELNDGGVKDISEWDNFDELDLGVSTTDIKYKHFDKIGNGLMKCNESHYSIVKTPIGNVIKYSREYLGGLLTLPFGRFVNIKNMPNDITKENIDGKKLKLSKK